MAKKYSKKSYYGRTYAKYKRRTTRRSRPNGYILRKNILTSTARRTIEVAYPIYAIKSSTTGAFGGHPFEYSLGVNQLDTSVNIMTPILATNDAVIGASREWRYMAQTYQLVRIRSVSAQYSRSYTDSLSPLISVGPLAAKIVPQDIGADDLSTMNNNFFADDALIVKPTAASSKVKTYRFPSRYINGSYNAWMNTSTLNNNSNGLFLNIGLPPSAAAASASTGYFNIMATTVNTPILLGSIVVKLYAEFSQPMIRIPS